MVCLLHEIPTGLHVLPDYIFNVNLPSQFGRYKAIEQLRDDDQV